MPRTIEELEAHLRELSNKENPTREDLDAVESIVKEVLTEYSDSIFASELRFQRGIYTLQEGEGYGHERLARALTEFREGLKAADKWGDKAEPWRSLNRTQVGVCLGRLGNIKDATTELKMVADVRPRSVLGYGALALLVELLKEDYPRDAKRYSNQKLSYARALVRENKESPDYPYFQLILAQELLGTEYAEEGHRLMQELSHLTPEQIDEELYHEIQEQLKRM